METQKVSASRAERSETIEALRKLFGKNQGGILADYRGLDVAKINDMRRQFKKIGVDYLVVKNTLARMAVADTSLAQLSEILTGPTAIAFSEKDVIGTAKVLLEFAKQYDKLKIKGGFMEGSVLDAKQVGDLSALGSRDQLLAQLLSVVNGPCESFLGTLNAVAQNFLGVLQARADDLEKQPQAAAQA